VGNVSHDGAQWCHLANTMDESVRSCCKTAEPSESDADAIGCRLVRPKEPCITQACTMAPPGKYDCIYYMRPRCRYGIMFREVMQMPLGDPRNHVSHKCAHWRHLANTIAYYDIRPWCHYGIMQTEYWSSSTTPNASAIKYSDEYLVSWLTC